MHTLKLSPFMLSLLLGACGGSDSGTDTPASDTTDATAATTPPGTSTSGAATTGDATVTTGGAATHTHDSDHDHSSSGDASTGHETGTTADTHADHGSTDHATSEAGTTAGGGLVEDYCLCMLDSCHDLYHGTWGEDHEQSEAMCTAAAEAVPSVGAPATSGDSIECRLHFCAMGHDVAGACEAAMGADPCVD
jgi:hypothetical protein